jgi:virulence factor Mce-like protein
MIKRRVQGLAFVVVLVAMVGLAVGKYAGAFESGVPVTLRVDKVGNQLSEKADVKIRGVEVGTVKAVHTDGSGATIDMSIDPDKVDLVPKNVSARLIPKTLFGEKYVSLVPPAGGGFTKIAAGDVIPQDRSQSAREVESALDALLPLLQDVEPQKLATTLSAVSMALDGRGEQLGKTLVNLQKLTNGIKPAIPELQTDISQLADFSGNLNQAAPDLLDALEDLSATSRTLVEQHDDLRDLFSSVTDASDDLRAFLAANKKNLISLADSSRPTLESLARYAPEYPCLFKQLAGIVPYINKTVRKGTDEPGLHISLEIVNNRGKYVPGDEPRYLDDRGPRCYPIKELGPQYPPDGPFKDGSKPPPASTNTEFGDPEEAGVVPASYKGLSVANSPGEQQVIGEIVAARSGTSPSEVPSWGSMLVGPLYRGQEVTVT